MAGIYVEVDGTLSGYFADLARAVAKRTGIEVDFVRYPSFAEAVAAQARQETDMIAGVAKLPQFQDTLVFSDAIAQMPVYLFVREETRSDPGGTTMQGNRVGFIADTGAADLADFGGAAEAVEFDTAASAFAALLVGDVDGVVTLYKVGADFLKSSRLDHRIHVAGLPLRTETSHVALSQRNADLLPEINAAIDEMTLSGELDLLLRRWNMVPPKREPDVLVVGVTHFPPYQIIQPDGVITGYGVETLREIAKLARLSLRFVPITTEEWAQGPGFGPYDILPPISVTDAKAITMDFTIPVQQSPYSIFLRADDFRRERISRLGDLAGMKVGVQEQNFARTLAEQQGNLTISLYASSKDLLDALLKDEVDAILFPSATTRTLLNERGQVGAVHEVFPPFHVSERAIALRFGLPDAREQMNLVIPGYLSSEAYLELNRRWLDPPQFWSRGRIALLQGVVGSLIAALTLGIGYQAWRSRRRDKAQAAAMRQTNARLGAILNTTHSAIIGLSRDGRITEANPGALKLLGISTEDGPTDWPASAIFTDGNGAIENQARPDPIQRALNGEVLTVERAHLQTKSGAEPRIVNVSSAQVDAHAASDVVTVLSIEDVTEQEHIRQQAERSGRLDALGQLTGGVAHDFNNILATIQYAAQLAEMNADDDQRRYLDSALNSVKRGEALTKRLLTFAKRQPSNRETVRIADIFADLQSLARPLLESSISLSFLAPPPDLAVTCDLAQLENALLNVILNSRDAILGDGGSGSILLSASTVPDSDLVCLCISDDGPGMSPAVLNRATDPFFTTKSQDKGTGLGLSMVYGFVEHAGGDLEIISSPGKGTSVKIRLPASRSDLPGSGVVAAVPGSQRGKGETILLVEDELSLLELTAESLRQLGYSVVTATSGREALENMTADTPRFDLVLTDVVMPHGVGGFELARRVRALRPTVPVVYMSGYTGINQDAKGVVVGPVLSKPCSAELLARCLREALDDPQASTASGVLTPSARPEPSGPDKPGPG